MAGQQTLLFHSLACPLFTQGKDEIVLLPFEFGRVVIFSGHVVHACVAGSGVPSVPGARVLRDTSRGRHKLPNQLQGHTRPLPDEALHHQEEAGRL
jgi:hypothetical protein